ncbi:hypothetical protein ACJX0J_024613, partial [Zea mays]
LYLFFFFITSQVIIPLLPTFHHLLYTHVLLPIKSICHIFHVLIATLFIFFQVIIHYPPRGLDTTIFPFMMTISRFNIMLCFVDCFHSYFQSIGAHNDTYMSHLMFLLLSSLKRHIHLFYYNLMIFLTASARYALCPHATATHGCVRTDSRHYHKYIYRGLPENLSYVEAYIY